MTGGDIFERSPEGISNRALFLGADYVAYCEGVEPAEACPDVHFWRLVSASYAPGLKVRVLPSGSKSDILAMYSKVSNESGSKALFFVDRDLDDLTGEMIEDPRVIYTWMYSFENEICSTEAFKDAVWTFFPDEECCRSADERLKGFFRSYGSLLLALAVMNQIGCVYSCCVMNRANYGRFYKQASYGRFPKIRRDEIAIALDKLKSDTESARPIRGSGAEWSSKRRLVGHFYYDIFYRVFVHCAWKIDKKFRLTKDNLKRIFLGKTFLDFPRRVSPEAHSHYVESFSRLNA